MMGFTQTKSRVLSIQIILICILIAIPLSQQAKPMPKCEAKFFYNILPLIPNQSAILNLDNLFDGYNLNFTLKGHEEWAKDITLTQKLRLQKKQIPDTPLIGLKSYHLQKIGNQWGTSFVAMSERGQRTYLSYGFLSSNTSAPVINNDIRVQNATNTTCYDAVSFPKQDMMIVDCAVKLQKPNQMGYYYINLFYYFKISDGSKIKTIQNDMYIPFETITRRKMQIYTEKASGNTYILRSYMFDGVDEKHQNNTYVDVIMMTKPMDPWTVAVIDRTFLKMTTLRVADIRVYLSEIYVLDFAKGLHRIRVNTEEDLIYNGFYQAKGFTRFAVYSNNLDDKFELALANSHQVYQIDWSHINDPILLTKYSLMPQSFVKQIFINQRFVIVLSSSTYTSRDDPSQTQYNYTWIFSRGDRTYTKAFQVLKHDTINTFVDLNMDQSFLMIIDDEKIANFAIDQGIMVLKLKRDQDYIDRIMHFTIVARSYQPTSKQQLNCSLTFNFTLIQQNNRTMWPVGAQPSPYYNANYPGKVVIPLYSYVLGPNITYKITQVIKGQLKKYKIYQQDQLKIHWQHQLPLQNTVFLRTQTINRQNQDILIIYTQNKQNTTYITYCTPNHKTIDMLCNQSSILPTQGQINNWATTLFYSRYSLKYHHITAYTTRKHYNKVIVDDISEKQNIIQIDMGKGFEGNVTHVQTYGRYMFVIKRYVKSILIFDLQMVVDDWDQPICTITHTLMYKLGVKYFSPQLIQTSQFYPNVLFIKTSDTIIVLDLNAQCAPKLLSVLRPVQNTLIQFSFMITLSHLVVTALPNSIIEYDLSRVYVKDIKMTKKYPIYGYKLPKNYDTDVSQYGNCMFITTISQGGDYQVFIYRAGYPAVASLYDVIDLYTYQPILIDASGSFIDYVTVFSNNELRIFREWEIPVAQVQNPQKNYQFWLQYYNVVTAVRLQLISVSIINLPLNITVNPTINDIMKTKDLLFSGYNRISQINDTNWYDGNVLTIRADCKDCDDKVIVRNHIHLQGVYTVMPSLVDYDWTHSGGALQAYDAILQLAHNGTVRDFVHIPQTSHSICISTSAPFHSNYIVSACIQGQGTNLYLTSTLSHKGFTFQPYSSKAQQLLKIQAVHELLILVDTSNNPFYKTRTGGVILYALNFDLDESQAFQQIQYIDYTDFGIDDKQLYIVNADLSYHPQTGTYRLYITQIIKGIYQLTFKYNGYDKGITILHINYISIPQMLAKTKDNPPYDATYQAVKAIQSTYDSTLQQSKDTVILTTGVYHTIMLQVTYNAAHVMLKAQIKKYFTRYAYYVVQNQIRYVNGLIVIRQVLPQEYQTNAKQQEKNTNINKNKYIRQQNIHAQNVYGTKSKQIISVYDIRSMPFNPPPSNKIPSVGLIGAQMIQDRQPRQFDFNLTFNYSDPHAQPRVNLVVVHQFSNQIDQMSLHRNLTVFTKQTVDTQIIYLDLINDFDIKKIRILLNGYAPFPQWKLITIILFSIIGFCILVGASVVGIRKFKAMRGHMQPAQDRTSLLTQEKSDGNNRYSTTSDKYQSKSKQASSTTKYNDSSSKKYQTSTTTANKYDNKYDSSSKYDNKYDSSTNKYDTYNKYDKYDSGNKYDTYNKYDSGSSSNKYSGGASASTNKYDTYSSNTNTNTNANKWDTSNKWDTYKKPQSKDNNKYDNYSKGNKYSSKYDDDDDDQPTYS